MTTKLVSLRAAQEAIEFGELAALALPSHPAAFAGVPPPLAMKEKEAPAAVARVQLLDAVARLRQQRVIAGERLRVGIGEVGQQREVQVVVAVAEKADLEIGDEVASAARSRSSPARRSSCAAPPGCRRARSFGSGRGGICS